VSDDEFDSVYSEQVRSASFRHWTPVAVARRAAQLLTGVGGATRILDVGAGPGKFCIVGALTTAARFAGIEQRPSLVEAAAVAVERFGTDRASVVHANMMDFDCTPFDGFYFFNPFRELVELCDAYPIDRTIDTSVALFKTYIACAIANLLRASVGTSVVTFHGFGGRMPPQYRRVLSEQTHGGELALWVRAPHSKRQSNGEFEARPVA
jgi:SAM-dependent methyltransferase